MTELLENSDNTNERAVVSESPANEAAISLAAVQALADALQKIEAYTPTVWVDNESPDIDAAHLNKAEQAIMRVTTAMNSAVDVIKDLQSQVNTTNNNLSNSRKIVQVITDDHGFSLGYDADNGLYTLVDLTRFYLVSKSDLLTQLLGNVKIAGEDARSSDELYSSLSGGTLYFFHCNGTKGIAAELGFSDVNNALCGFIYKASTWRGCGILIPMTGAATDYNMFVGRLESENHLKWVGVK